MRTQDDKALTLLLLTVSLAFLWVLWPFSDAILWGGVVAIVFAPLYRWLLVRTGQRRTVAALVAVTIIVLIVILPLALVGLSLVQEAVDLYGKTQSGEINFQHLSQRMFDALPNWLGSLLDRFGMTNLKAVQLRLSAAMVTASESIATWALRSGQSTFNIVVDIGVMIYLLFFMMRDGDALIGRVQRAMPLSAQHQRELLGKFTVVIRATVKGDLLVAALQGALGGVMFWFLGIHAPVLGAVLMAFMSLMPAVGAALVWLPVAIYLLATGSVWQGVTLILYGALVIGSIDNILRPLLVGKDTKMPNVIVLISTLGGIASFGLNGFIIGPVIAAMFVAVWELFFPSAPLLQPTAPPARDHERGSAHRPGPGASDRTP
jgi:predicted PurR-regulated permease PerM